MRSYKAALIELSRRLLPPVAIVLVLTAAMFALHPHLWDYPELRYPPGPDQISYLTEAPDFQNHLLVDPKVPLYTVWLSLFFASAPNLYWTFYVERYASILLLSVLVCLLGRRLFDLRTGFFLGFWTLNAKYLVIEPNGSNALAASMFVAAALCLTTRKPQRWPATVFFLFLSSLARPEMLLPLMVVILYLVWKAIVWFRTRWRESATAASSKWYYWAALVLVVAGLTAFIKTRANLSFPWSPSFAFFAGFAVNYVKRNGLLQQYPNPWLATPQIIAQVMPRVTEPVSPLASPIRGIIQAWAFYPRECLYHTAYNLKMAIITVPAVAFGFYSRFLMLIAAVAWLGSYYFVRRRQRANFTRVPENVWRDLIVLSVASASLLAALLCFLVMWRYAFPFLPVILFAIAYLVHHGLSAIVNRLQKRSRL